MAGVQWLCSPRLKADEGAMLCRRKQVGGGHVLVSCQAERMPTSAEETKNGAYVKWGRAESDAMQDSGR